MVEGNTDGLGLGTRLGDDVSDSDDTTLGLHDGAPVGSMLGSEDGPAEGVTEGLGVQTLQHGLVPVGHSTSPNNAPLVGFRQQG